MNVDTQRRRRLANFKPKYQTLERAEYFELKAKTKPCLDVMTMSNAMKVATTFLRRGHEKQLLD